MLFSLIFVSLLSFSVNPVYGVITITSHPAKVVNGHYVKLICDVGTMENTVKWVYDAVTYFSCDPPYTNCFTNINTTNDEYYDFSINNDSLIAIILVRKRQNDGIWSCYHGNETDNFKIDNGDTAEITQLGNYRPALCGVKSETPVDVLIYTLGYEGTRILYDVKQSNLSRHRPNDFMLCSETHLYCNASNGYGWPRHAFKEKEVSVFCPLKVLYNISTLTVSLDDEHPFGENGKIKIYFEGYFLPTRILYRIGPDDIPEDSDRIGTGIHEQTLQGPAYFYISVYRDKKGPVKAGKYVLTIKQKHITEVVYINIMNPTTTTASPTETSTMNTTEPITKDNKWPKTTPSPVKTSMKYANYRPTTNRPEEPQKTAYEDRMKKNYNSDLTSKEEFERKTPDEMTTMLYLGVAGFVMSLLLVLMLVVFGVFWFNGVKRKPAGSVYPNKDPIIYTKT